jgi:hypothetical protein
MNKIMIGTFGLFLFAAPVLAGASTEIADSRLQVKEYNGVPYVSGGFGVEERDQLGAIRNGYNLQLSFALQSGNYLGGANVEIRDSRGKTVFEGVSDGPLFFAKLPPGKYTIDATAVGKTIAQVAQAPAKGQTHVYFAWRRSQGKGSTTS